MKPLPLAEGQARALELISAEGSVDRQRFAELMWPEVNPAANVTLASGVLARMRGAGLLDYTSEGQVARYELSGIGLASLLSYKAKAEK